MASRQMYYLSRHSLFVAMNYFHLESRGGPLDYCVWSRVGFIKSSMSLSFSHLRLRMSKGLVFNDGILWDAFD